MPNPPIPLPMAELVKALEPFVERETAFVAGEVYVKSLSREDVRTLARIASALPSYVLAPREPTDDMLRRGWANRNTYFRSGAWAQERAIYCAMLAAAEASDNG